jgi:hypothetical protein
LLPALLGAALASAWRCRRGWQDDVLCVCFGAFLLLTIAPFEVVPHLSVGDGESPRHGRRGWGVSVQRCVCVCVVVACS